MVTQENFRFRIDTDLKAAWMGLCERKKISQQHAIAAVLRWVVAQDDLTQTLIFQQMAPESERQIAELALRKLMGAEQVPSEDVPASGDRPTPYVRGARKRDAGNRG